MSGRGEEIMDFIEGKFLYAATPDGQRGGYKVIFMVFNNIRNMACGILPRLYLMLIKVIRFRFPNCTLLLRLLTGFTLPYLFLFTFVHYRTLFVIMPTVKDVGFWGIFYLSAVVMTLIIFFVVLFSQPATINSENEKAAIRQLVEEDKFLKKVLHRCEACKVYHILRSYHCVMCNHHVCKYHTHSSLFNKCIAAGNQLPYAVFFLFSGIGFFLASQIVRMERIEGFTLSKFSRIVNNLYFVILFLYSVSQIHDFVKQIAFILLNMTEHERTQWYKLAYMWAGLNKNFYNPFDKGIIANLTEEFNTLLNIDPTPIKKPTAFDDQSAKLNDLENSEKNLEAEDKQRICNWRKQRYLGLYNLYCSPMRKIILDNIKKSNDSDDED